jgi:OOP family OmpA-OmpF porin
MAFKPYYPLNRYDKQQYGLAIDELPIIPQSPPMLQTGLMKLEHLLGLPGKTEVFIFSDGNDSTYESLEPFPIEQARKLVSMYDVCFTVVSSAQTVEEKQKVEAIGSLNDCSQVIDFDTVYNNPEHLFGRLYQDTLNNGFDNVLFDFDKTAIKPEYRASLDRLGEFLKDNPRLYAVLSGFTDNIGTKTYNINLSKRRAESAQNYLVGKFNLSKERLLLYWYGYSNPVATNATPEGRQLNRRVTIEIRQSK